MREVEIQDVDVLAAPLPVKKEVRAAKRGVWKTIITHARRIVIEIFNALFNHDFIFWIIGRVFNIKSVFLVYPANPKYALAYAYPKRLAWQSWNPYLSGAMWNSGGKAIMFAIPNGNGEFSDKKNLENLRKVVERMEQLRILFRAERKTFAGILPGILFVGRIVKKTPEADLTAMAVAKTIGEVKERYSMDEDTPIVVLGGRGFIGRRVMKLLERHITFSVDIKDNPSGAEWPSLDGKRPIVINVTLRDALEDYVDLIPVGSIVVNEVYPPPRIALEKLSKKGCVSIHLKGVRATAIPSFPGDYTGAIPCCAAWPTENMEVVWQEVEF